MSGRCAVRGPPQSLIFRKRDAFFDRELQTFTNRIWYLAPVTIDREAGAREIRHRDLFRALQSRQ